VRRRRFNVGRVLVLSNPLTQTRGVGGGRGENAAAAECVLSRTPCRVARLVSRRAPALHRAHDAPRVLSHYGILQMFWKAGGCRRVRATRDS